MSRRTVRGMDNAILYPEPPTEKQLRYLERLGYTGEQPVTKHEASVALDELVTERGQYAAESAILNVRGAKRSWTDQVEVKLPDWIVLPSGDRANVIQVDIVIDSVGGFPVGVRLNSTDGNFGVSRKGECIGRDDVSRGVIRFCEAEVHREFSQIVAERSKRFNLQAPQQQAETPQQAGPPPHASPFQSEGFLDAEIVRDLTPLQPSIIALAFEFCQTVIVAFGGLLIWLCENACRHSLRLYWNCRGPVLNAGKKVWAWCSSVWCKLTAPIVAYYRKYK